MRVLSVPTSPWDTVSARPQQLLHRSVPKLFFGSNPVPAGQVVMGEEVREAEQVYSQSGGACVMAAESPGGFNKG